MRIHRAVMTVAVTVIMALALPVMATASTADNSYGSRTAAHHDSAPAGPLALAKKTAAGPATSGGTVSPSYVGIGVWTTIPTASIFQCPWTYCNQGQVTNDKDTPNPDDVAAICYMPWNSPWGHPWVLVLDHTDSQTGFIDLGFLYAHNGGSIGPC